VEAEAKFEELAAVVAIAGVEVEEMALASSLEVAEAPGEEM
jgi:hypothetical protein